MRLDTAFNLGSHKRTAVLKINIAAYPGLAERFGLLTPSANELALLWVHSPEHLGAG